MTISSSGAEATAGPDIKRQSARTAGTNSERPGGGGRECEKVNTKDGTRRFASEWTDSQIYIRTDGWCWVGECNSSILMPSLARSLPVNVSMAERSHGPQSDRLHTYYICGAGNSPAARSASSSSLRDEGKRMEAQERKRTERVGGGEKKEKINLQNKCKSAEKGWWNGCLSTLQWFPYPLLSRCIQTVQSHCWFKHIEILSSAGRK